MTLQSIRSTPPAATATSADAAMALENRAAPTSSKTFTRSSVNADRSDASIASAKDRNPPPTPRMAKDVPLILAAASRQMQPGQAKEVLMKDFEFVLYRTRSGDGLVMQSEMDYRKGLQNGLFIGLDVNKQPVMSYDKKPVSTTGSEFAFAAHSLECMKAEFGLSLF